MSVLSALRFEVLFFCPFINQCLNEFKELAAKFIMV